MSHVIVREAPLTESIDAQWETAVNHAPVVKTPATRLLDLLAGWAEYAQHDEFPDSPATLAAIAHLTQEAGEFAFADGTPDAINAEITHFVQNRVLPLLTSRT